MKSNMTWLVGRQVKDIAKKDWSWFFYLDDGSSLATESPWRLITTEGIFVTSEDHGQQFGLPTPVDAVQLAKTKVGGKTINQFELDGRTGDLSLFFVNKIILQFLNLSSGYEGWRADRGLQQIVCMGGGKVTEWKAHPEESARVYPVEPKG